MYYQIIPLEIGSLVERHIFQQKDREIKCGMVWKLGSIVTMVKPKFTKTYNPSIGICINDIPGGKINDVYGGEKVIYFSDTIDEDEQNDLTDIFYQTNPKYSKNYVDVFLDLGWKKISTDSYIFGEIEIKELREIPNKFK